MGFPQSFPLWMWLYSGTFGSAGTVLFTLIVLSWMKMPGINIFRHKTWLTLKKSKKYQE
jgi:hypothetical protein